MSQPKVSKSSIFAIIAGVNEQYEILKNWEKVAQHFGLTRRVIQGIRKKDS